MPPKKIEPTVSKDQAQKRKGLFGENDQEDFPSMKKKEVKKIEEVPAVKKKGLFDQDEGNEPSAIQQKKPSV